MSADTDRILAAKATLDAELSRCDLTTQERQRLWRNWLSRWSEPLKAYTEPVNAADWRMGVRRGGS